MSVRPELKLTYGEYLDFPRDGNRYEILDGELVVRPSAGRRHHRLVLRLSALVERFLARYALGQVFRGPLDVMLSETDVVQPDLLYLSKKRARRLTEACVQGAPDLIVEVSTPESRVSDRTQKREAYERFDLWEYWRFDLEWEAVEVYRRDVKHSLTFRSRLEKSAGGVLTSPLLAGLEISLPALFALADRTPTRPEHLPVSTQ